MPPEHRAAGVLVTRPEPGAAETAARLAVLGWTPVMAPMLAITARTPALPPPGSVQALLAASGNAVAAIPKAHRRLPLLAVGDATAARARAAGCTDVLSADGDAADLARLAAARLHPAAGPLLLLAGAGHGTPLVTALRAAGFRVQRRIAYASDPVPVMPGPAEAALRDGRLAAAMFFSGKAARCFVALAAQHARVLGTVDALAIGTLAAVALEALPWRSIRVARRPTQDEMFALLP